MNYTYFSQLICKPLKNGILSKVIPILSAIMICLRFTPALCADFTGNWSGTWWSDYGGSGSVSANVTQTGASLTGTASVATAACGNFYNLPLTGSVSGDLANFHCAAICPIDGSYNELYFTNGLICGNTVTGYYQVIGSSGYYDSGTFIISRDYMDTVQKVFIGYYQRPAAPAGLIFWANQLNEVDGNLDAIIEAFANSAESRALYGEINSGNIRSVVTHIFQALFNRDPAPAGLNYYENGFNSKQFTAATIMLNVLDGATGTDLQSVNNKVTASNLFTWTIDPDLDGTNFQATYTGDTDAQNARYFLSTVTWDPATIPTQAGVTLLIKTYIADAGDPILTP